VALREGGEGSHRVYRHADGGKVVLACHGKDVKPAYIRQLRQLLK
jgi:predicted RNA binding protein YcfA (HicA-like mRNA interferase family)